MRRWLRGRWRGLAGRPGLLDLSTRMLKISSVQNPRLREARRRRERSGPDEQGRIIVDGVREIGQALAAGVEVLEVFFFAELCRDEEHQRLLATAEKARADLIEVTSHVMEKMSFGQRMEGVVAVAGPPQRGLGGFGCGAGALGGVVGG